MWETPLSPPFLSDPVNQNRLLHEMIRVWLFFCWVGSYNLLLFCRVPHMRFGQVPKCSSLVPLFQSVKRAVAVEGSLNRAQSINNMAAVEVAKPMDKGESEPSEQDLYTEVRVRTTLLDVSCGLPWSIAHVHKRGLRHVSLLILTFGIAPCVLTAPLCITPLCIASWLGNTSHGSPPIGMPPPVAGERCAAARRAQEASARRPHRPGEGTVRGW